MTGIRKRYCDTSIGQIHLRELAAGVIPGADLVEVPEVTTAVFEAGAEAIARRIEETLDV